MDKLTIEAKLKEIAFRRSTAFCYQDYIKCPTGRCPKCGSDDLMRITDDDGPEYGTDWIIEEILRKELTPVPLDVAFEDHVRACYEEEVKVGWMTFDAAYVMKEMDPVSWQLALGEWESNELDKGGFYSPDNGTTIYQAHEVERLVEEELKGER